MNPTPTTLTAEVADEIRDLAIDIIRRAVDRYHQTNTQAERARELAQLDRRLDKWAEHEGGLAIDAQEDLLRAILTTAPGFYSRATVYPEKHVWPPIGITLGDSTYLVVADPDQEGDIRRDGPNRMMLVVVPRDAIRDITSGLDPAMYSPRKVG